MKGVHPQKAFRICWNVRDIVEVVRPAMVSLPPSAYLLCSFLSSLTDAQHLNSNYPEALFQIVKSNMFLCKWLCNFSKRV